MDLKNTEMFLGQFNKIKLSRTEATGHMWLLNTWHRVSLIWVTTQIKIIVGVKINTPDFEGLVQKYKTLIMNHIYNMYLYILSKIYQ